MGSTMTAPVPAYVGLGSNLGDRLETLRVAVGRLDESAGVRVTACSPVYESGPLGPVRDQPAFLNAVCAVATTLAPRALLDRLLEVEQGLGRVRGVPQGPRVIDLDLLLFDVAAVDEPGLCVPHPQLAKRAFVLAPLLDLAPALRHPLTGEPLRDARARLLSQTITPFAPASALAPAARGQR
jgi:2-amino-4-hydroxy-6-hydroxymethyldihydropteridine diphosphokinase